jgi:hypothetical protein
MFDIIFKKKKIVVDCFTSNVNAYDLFPIKESKEFYPEWWKNLPKIEPTENKNGMLINRSNMKRCEGFMSLYQQGFIIPLWSDVVIQTQAVNCLFEFADGISNLTHHGGDQLSQEWYNYVHAKFESPWRIQEKTGVKFAFIQPSWNTPRDLMFSHTPPGVIDFKYQHTSSINIFLLKSKRYEWSAGLPLAQLLPLSENNIELKTHFVSDNELNVSRVMNRNLPFFESAYRKLKKIKQGQCPYKD